MEHLPPTLLPSPPVPLLSVRHASKRYGGVPALIDAEIDVFPGEVHALMGENGAGKSTLIRLLAGVTAADKLDVAMRDRPVKITSPHAAFSYGLRFIHQELNIVPGLSVAENIFLGQPYPRRFRMLVDWPTLNDRARAVLARLAVSHIPPTVKVSRLSPGDRMLVKIASAMTGVINSGGLSDALVYVMDEPTAALSRLETERLFAVIASLQNSGAGILYVSHRMDEIFAIADRVTVMRDGRVIATTSISETSPNEIIQQMTGRALDQTYPERTRGRRESVALEVRSLHTRVLADISFDLHEGEILGVAGLTGAGRSELLRALMGIDRPTRGTVMLHGKRNRLRSPVAMWRGGLAFTPEERRAQGVFLSRSVRDNVALPHSRGLFLSRRRESRQAAHLGRAVRLKTTGTHQRVRQLSGGNQQKVLFARAIAGNPRLLLLDEPTRGVDMGAKYDIYALIREAADAGKGVLLISSELGELIGLCDRILIMHEGKLANIVTTDGLTQAKLLALCYGDSQPT